MPKKALEQRLSELHNELASASQLDPQLRALAKDVAGDIEKLLAEESDRAERSAADELRERVQQATVDFEAEHPRLAHVLNDLADTLTKLGI